MTLTVLALGSVPPKVEVSVARQGLSYSTVEEQILGETGDMGTTGDFGRLGDMFILTLLESDFKSLGRPTSDLLARMDHYT